MKFSDIKSKIRNLGGFKSLREIQRAGLRIVKTHAGEYWLIESEFLKPVIKSPRECKTILIDPTELKYKIFLCHKTKEELKGTSALEYIHWGEQQGFHQRPSCASRPRWWEIMGSHNGRLAWAVIHASRHSVHVNNSGVQLDNNFFEILGQDVISQEVLCAYAVSILGIMVKELFGRQYGGGSGPIKTNGVDIVQLPFIKSDQIAWSKENRKIFNVHIQNKSFLVPMELKSNKYSALDSMIFDILGLTQGEREAVYEAVIQLVQARLKKAASV